VLRLEKSIQIGRPVDEVFNAWTDWDRLPRVSENVSQIIQRGDQSRWSVNVGGQTIEWTAITEQFIPNQAIGWKSIEGPKHTGRITFSPLRDDTLVHIAMNYAPPVRVLRPLMAPMTGHMEGVIEKVLRDFKASVESRPRGLRTGVKQPGPGSQVTTFQRTGTYGDELHESRLGGISNPMNAGPSDVKR
jgi:uncharacterized membrane protein